MTFITPTQAAERLQVSTRTLLRLIKRGEIPALRVGRSWRIDPAALQPSSSTTATQEEVQR